MPAPDDDMSDETMLAWVEQQRMLVEKQIAAARAEGAREEREACATICTQVIEEYRAGVLAIGDWTAAEVERRIRARKEPA